MNLFRVTPFLHVPDIAAALQFFSSTLGFRVGLRIGTYAFVWRDNAAFRLLENKQAPAGHGGFAYYIDVEDLAALYSELKPRLKTLPQDAVRGPLDQPYGQRELMIRAPDGNLLVFGQEIRTDRAARD